MQHLPRTHQRAATLVEILVVIVVFLVGILGVAQIFPRGLSILRTTNNNSVALNLARAEIERLKGQSEQIAEAILPVQYTAGGVTLDLDQRPSTMFPNGTTAIRQSDGVLLVSGNPVGPWGRYTGANVVRRVIGEGKKVPQPRFVPMGGGIDQFGAILNLQFGPLFNTNSLTVYGPDMVRSFNPNQRWNSNTFLTDEDGISIAVPQSAVARAYRLEFNYIASVSGNFESRTMITTVPVAAGSQTFVAFALSAISGDPAFQHAEIDTIRVQRLYQQIPVATAFTTGAADDSAFEYKVLDGSLGTLLFNPLGYGYEIQTRRARVPLSARVDYDVFDWRIIREDFRALAAGQPFRLALRSLKVKGIAGPDGKINTGLGFTVKNGNGGTSEEDFVLVDLETGGIITPSSYSIDKSNGQVTFNTTTRITYTGTTSSEPIALTGRRLRALYMGRNEFAVQVSKAAATYVPTSSATVGFKQCYIGATNGAGDGLPTRLYFPLADIGKKVVIGELWYQDGSGTPKVVEDQTFVIQAPSASDWQPMAFVDIRELRPAATGFDFSNGYAVRRVRGASVDVRVSWNPASWQLGPDAENVGRLQTYFQNNRRSLTESFIVRGVEQ